jgi:hypothetical protein
MPWLTSPACGWVEACPCRQHTDRVGKQRNNANHPKLPATRADAWTAIDASSFPRHVARWTMRLTRKSYCVCDVDVWVNVFVNAWKGTEKPQMGKGYPPSHFLHKRQNAATQRATIAREIERDRDNKQNPCFVAMLQPPLLLQQHKTSLTLSCMHTPQTHLRGVCASKPICIVDNFLAGSPPTPWDHFADNTHFR